MEIRAGGGSSGPGNPGGGGVKKIMPSVGGVWIFSGITHYHFLVVFVSFKIYCAKQTLTNIDLYAFVLTLYADL